MTNFVQSDFSIESGWIYYGKDRRFVARCRRRIDTKGFISFIVKNFLVEEYFNMLENMGLPPGKILESKGYVSATVKKCLKQVGYSATIEGFKKYIEDQSSIRAA